MFRLDHHPSTGSLRGDIQALCQVTVQPRCDVKSRNNRGGRRCSRRFRLSGDSGAPKVGAYAGMLHRRQAWSPDVRATIWPSAVMCTMSTKALAGDGSGIIVAYQAYMQPRNAGAALGCTVPYWWAYSSGNREVGWYPLEFIEWHDRYCADLELLGYADGRRNVIRTWRRTLCSRMAVRRRH